MIFKERLDMFFTVIYFYICICQLLSVFIEASQNFESFHNKAAKKFQTIGADTESTDLIF
jgi:hypothetical protein